MMGDMYNTISVHSTYCLHGTCLEDTELMYRPIFGCVKYSIMISNKL